LGLPETRIVFTEHGRLSDAPPSRKRRLANRCLSMGVASLYAVSYDLRRHLVAEGFPERMGVIWNGIDPGPAPDERARRQARTELGLPAGTKGIGTVARLDPVKDLHTLLKAFAEVRCRFPIRLLVIGDGPERESLKALAELLNVAEAVTWMGQRQDVRQLLPGLDVYVNSSISEGVSLTLLEAMAAALPVVATHVGGTAEVVLNGETGLLCPARSPGALSRQLERVLGDASLAARYGRTGRRRVSEHFTLDRMVERYEQIYKGST
jgi:glycosyltransferase involved in cell wall biosynthesis